MGANNTPSTKPSDAMPKSGWSILSSAHGLVVVVDVVVVAVIPAAVVVVVVLFDVVVVVVVRSRWDEKLKLDPSAHQ